MAILALTMATALVCSESPCCARELNLGLCYHHQETETDLVCVKHQEPWCEDIAAVRAEEQVVKKKMKQDN